MTGIEALDSAKVDTGKIVSVFHDNFTKFVEKEPKVLADAINGMRIFLSTETPVWEKPPEYDKLNKEIFHGTPKEILYQFEAKNKHFFDEYSYVIDMAMGVIPRVKMHMWKQLKLHKQSQPVDLPMPISNEPPPQHKFLKSVTDKFRLEKPMNPVEDEIDMQIRDWMKWADDVAERYGYFKHWYYKSVYYGEGKITFSNIYPRNHMEILRNELSAFFDYYIVKRFMEIFHYAMDLELRNITDDARAFTDAVARQQKEHEMNPPMS